jgi:glycosyltransferase involved in cell wall biosynthesis
MPPKVSVNICCRNGEKFIKDAIESVQKQTFKDLEIVVLNDGSTDNTEAVIKKFDDPRIRYFYQENMGLGPARNKAIELSRAGYIALLDCDDVWEPEKLELQVKILDDNPDVGLVHSDGYLVTEDNRIMNRFFQIRRPGRGNVAEDTIKNYQIACSSVLMRKEVLDKSGYFGDEFRIVEEYDLFLRMALVTKFDYIDKTLVKIKVHPGNISKDLEKYHKEVVMSLNSLSKKIDDDHLKICIYGELSKYHAELALVYLFKRLPVQARSDIRRAIEYGGYRPWVLAMYLSSYLPGGLSYPASLALRKGRSFFRKLRLLAYS